MHRWAKAWVRREALRKWVDTAQDECPFAL